MGAFGMGIGSFMEGLSNGINLRRKLDNDEADRAYQDRRMNLLEGADKRAGEQQQFERGMSERRMKLAEGQDARAAESQSLDTQKKKADLEFEQNERAADAPIRTAKRKSILNAAQDEEDMRTTQKQGTADARKTYDDQKSKSVVRGKDEAGNDTFTVDGQKVASQDEADKLFEQKHGTFMDAYRATVVPKVQEAYLSRGDVKSAEAWGKWNDDARVRKGIDTAGRLETAFRAGDWDRVNTHLNDLAKNKDYMALDGHDIKAEPIKDKDGRTTGLKATYKNKATGETRTEEFKDMEALHTGLMGMVNPASVFEWNKQQLDAVNAGKIKMAEEDRKQSNTIEQKRVESALKIGEERAKQGLGDPKEYAKGVLETWKQLDDSKALVKKNADGTSERMTHEEQLEAAERTYRAIRARAGQPGARVTAPTVVQPQRTLMSRPPGAPAAPADAPAPAAQQTSSASPPSAPAQPAAPPPPASDFQRTAANPYYEARRQAEIEGAYPTKAVPLPPPAEDAYLPGTGRSDAERINARRQAEAEALRARQEQMIRDKIIQKSRSIRAQ